MQPLTSKLVNDGCVWTSNMVIISL